MAGTLTLACGSFSPELVVALITFYYAPLVLAGLFTVLAVVLGLTSHGKGRPGLGAVVTVWGAGLVAQFALWQPLLQRGF